MQLGGAALPRIGWILAAIVLLAAAVLAAVLFLPPGIDWQNTYRPAALALLAGRSPFDVEIYFAAPWALLPLLPFALLPAQVGRGALFVLGLLAFAYTGSRLGAKPVALAAFLLSPPVLHCLLNANIEWLPLLGFVLPPQIGLFFIAIKPQIGAAVGVFWLVEAWRRGGPKEVVRVFWPVSAALGISFLLFGLWPLRFQQTIALTQSYNASLWPLSIPVGLALLAAALRRRSLRPAMAASPCLSPYVLLHAWVGALAAILELPLETVVAVLGLWLVVLLRGLGG